jgi:hypothetical protein
VYVADKNVAVILRAGHWSMVLSLVSACQISAGSNKNLKVTGGAVTCPRAGSELKPYMSNESISVSLCTMVVVTCRFCYEWQFEGLVDLISWCVDLCRTSGKRTD